MRKVIQLMAMLVLIIGIGFGNASAVQAESPDDDQAIVKAVKDEMRKKTIQSGTLDLYDEDIEAIRNLRVITFPGKAEKKDDKFFAMIDYRDINSGDVVTVKALLTADGEGYTLEDVQIAEVKPLEKEEVEKKDYTDEEIQDFMNSYIEQQAKFTGSVMLYDEEREVMRNLTMTELKPEVKRLGIFYTSRGVFEDIETGDTLGVDVAVQNKDGKLEIQALRIRSYQKAKK